MRIRNERHAAAAAKGRGEQQLSEEERWPRNGHRPCGERRHDECSVQEKERGAYRRKPPEGGFAPDQTAGIGIEIMQGMRNEGYHVSEQTHGVNDAEE